MLGSSSPRWFMRGQEQARAHNTTHTAVCAKQTGTQQHPRVVAPWPFGSDSEHPSGDGIKVHSAPLADPTGRAQHERTQACDYDGCGDSTLDTSPLDRPDPTLPISAWVRSHCTVRVACSRSACCTARLAATCRKADLYLPGSASRAPGVCTAHSQRRPVASARKHRNPYRQRTLAGPAGQYRHGSAPRHEGCACQREVKTQKAGGA